MEEGIRSGLNTLLNPRGIVLYGASDKSNWSQAIAASSRSYGFKGNFYALNRRGVEAHGLPGFASAKDLPGDADAAYIYVPTDGVIDAFEDLASAGVRSAVILSSGFADAGHEGQRLQERLVETAKRLGITFLGPNCLGFANVHTGAAVSAFRPMRPFRPGGIALLSQSGAVCYEIMEFAVQQNVDLGFIAAMGNEAMLDITDLVESQLENDEIKAIALFVETIRRPDRFLEVAARALELKKPIVMLKVGTSEISAAIAQAHTGSLIGNDRVLDAACRQASIIRVRSIEELINTSALLCHTGIIEKEGIGVASLSGGTCSLVADAAEAVGLRLPPLAPETIAALRDVLPSFASTLNPLDVTGAAFNDLELWGKCLKIVSRDPSIGLTIAAGTLLPLGAVGPATGAALTDIGAKSIFLCPTSRPVDPVQVEKLGIPAAFTGLDGISKGVADAIWWSKRILSGQKPAQRSIAAEGRTAARPRLQGERAVLDHLASFGVPVIPATIAKTAEEAVAAARAIGADAYALKIASPDIAHKTEVGGVRLNVSGDTAIAQAFDAILASVKSAKPRAMIDGIIVSPMRDRGIELIISTINDPDWGPAIVVGLGGIWVELLKDSSLRVLPVTKSEAREMVENLRAVALLKGYRGAVATDLDKLAEVIVGVGNAAFALGPDLATLELNPVRVAGSEIEALDGLATYR